MSEEIDIFKVLNYIRDNSKAYASAKANRVYLEEYRKSKKAILMQQAEKEGHTSAAAQEREAYANPEYKELLDGLKEAVEAEESLRWMLIAAQAKVECWRTLESNKRAEAKIL